VVLTQSSEPLKPLFLLCSYVGRSAALDPGEWRWQRQ